METSFGCIFNFVGCALGGRRWSVPLVRMDGQGSGQSIWLTRSFEGVGVGNDDLRMGNRGSECVDMAKII